MIEHQGIWLPDGETHLTKWMTQSGEIVDGKGTYQIKKLRAAMLHCRTTFRTAVDVGAHVGMWTMQLAKMFKFVHSFEPVAAHRECFERNLDMGGGQHCLLDNVELYPYALGDHEGSVSIVTAPTSSGDSRVGVGIGGDIPLVKLDDFGVIKDVDFIKLDCEGYELLALKGGEQIIRRDLPTIIVEQKPGRAQTFGLPERGAVEWLGTLGYRCAQEMSGDFIMVPK